jgi:hypothetical protein
MHLVQSTTLIITNLQNQLKNWVIINYKQDNQLVIHACMSKIFCNVEIDANVSSIVFFCFHYFEYKSIYKKLNMIVIASKFLSTVHSIWAYNGVK